MENKNILHVINKDGHHITIPSDNINEASNNTGYKYMLDVEWYRSHGYCTFEDLEEKLKAIKTKYDHNKSNR